VHTVIARFSHWHKPSKSYIDHRTELGCNRPPLSPVELWRQLPVIPCRDVLV